jgi:hypothetical protein
MQLEFYSLPIMFEGLISKKELSKCNLQQSVYQHLHLLITTGFGGFPADKRFGCGIWDHDFDNVTSAHKLKEIFRQSLQQSIQEHEKRLSNIRVEIMLREEELEAGEQSRKIKKRIDIAITGLLKLTNERFAYRDTFFVGPLSY